MVHQHLDVTGRGDVRGHSMPKRRASGCDGLSTQALPRNRAPLTLAAPLSKVHIGISPACVANAM